MRRYITVAIVFLTMGSVFGIERADKIPGIDPMSMAQGEPTGISNEKPADNTFYALSTIALVLFTLELSFNMLAKPGSVLSSSVLLC